MPPPPPLRLRAAAALLLLLAIAAPPRSGGDGTAAPSFASAFGVVRGRRLPATAVAEGGGPAVPSLSSTREVVVGAEVEKDETATDDATEVETGDDGDDSSTMTLNFVGEATTVSAPAPRRAGGDKSPRAFFALPQSVALLMRGSKNNRVEELESTSAELWERYRESCDRVGASLPAQDDRMFEVTTSGVKFLPGLRVMCVATIGAKAIDKELPGYELVYVRSSMYAEGNRLFVWIFNKATGKDKDGDQGEPSGAAPTTTSLTRIRVVPGEDDTVCFASDASLSVRVQFPAFLMKAVPGASKEKSERIGGDSFRAALEKDCAGSLELFRDEYVRWSGGSIPL